MSTFLNFVKVAAAGFLLVFGNAQAERREIFQSANNGQPSWKLENYPGNNVAIWNTPSTCVGGSIGFPDYMTNSDKSRFYATLMAVKTSNVTMFIYYDEVPGTCLLVSFGLL